MKLNSNRRYSDVTIAPSGTLRAVYISYDMGLKGRLQELDRENGRWITVGYYADYPQLMSAFPKAVQKG